jgi:integrase
MPIEFLPAIRPQRGAWTKGRIVGQKRPLQPKHVWSIRVRLEMADNPRDLALFNMAIDSMLRGCDLVQLRVRDVFVAGRVRERASITQRKTGRPVRFEITEPTRQSLERWIANPDGGRRFSLAEPLPRQPSPFHPAVCSDPAWLGYFHRA